MYKSEVIETLQKYPELEKFFIRYNLDRIEIAGDYSEQAEDSLSWIHTIGDMSILRKLYVDKFKLKFNESARILNIEIKNLHDTEHEDLDYVFKAFLLQTIANCIPYFKQESENLCDKIEIRISNVNLPKEVIDLTCDIINDVYWVYDFIYKPKDIHIYISNSRLRSVQVDNKFNKCRIELQDSKIDMIKIQGTADVKLQYSEAVIFMNSTLRKIGEPVNCYVTLQTSHPHNSIIEKLHMAADEDAKILEVGQLHNSQSKVKVHKSYGAIVLEEIHAVSLLQGESCEYITEYARVSEDITGSRYGRVSKSFSLTNIDLLIDAFLLQSYRVRHNTHKILLSMHAANMIIDICVRYLGCIEQDYQDYKNVEQDVTDFLIEINRYYAVDLITLLTEQMINISEW